MAVPEARLDVADLQRDPDEALRAVSRDGALVWVRAGRGRFLLVSAPELVREVLVERSTELAKPRSQAIFVGKPVPEQLDGRLSPARLRRSLTKGMGADRAAETAELLRAAVAADVAGWRDGEEVRVLPWLRPLVIRAVGGGAFASSLSDEEVSTLEGVLRWSDAAARVEGGRPTKHTLTRPLALARLSVVARSMLANVDLSRPSELSALVAEDAEFAPSFGENERLALTGELLVGAVGPLVQSAGWALVRLEEWDRVGDPQDFVRELTRLHPTNPRITRTALVDTTVGDEPVPAHTRVIVNVDALQRDPLLYDEPDRFLPERWQDGRSPEQKFAYAAFGIGDRRCLGEAIALRTLAALVEALAGWNLTFGEVDVSQTGRRQLADDVVATVSRL